MVAFCTSVVVTLVLIAIGIAVGRRRAPGTPLTWGEAFVATAYLFAVFLLLYGVVPDQWLRWADGGLAWRSDKIGIPTGPLHANFHWGPFVMKGHLLWPDGVPLPNGHFVITAQTLRDIVVSTIYIVALAGHVSAWLWWQRRGKKAAQQPELEQSAFGRPLLRAMSETS